MRSQARAGRVRVSPAGEREALRTALLVRYGADRRVTNLIACDLRPLFVRCCGDSPRYPLVANIRYVVRELDAITARMRERFVRAGRLQLVNDPRFLPFVRRVALRQLYPPGIDPDLDAIANFVREPLAERYLTILDTSTVRLGLCHAHRPAAWAVQALHERTAGRPVGLDLSPPYFDLGYSPDVEHRCRVTIEIDDWGRFSSHLEDAEGQASVASIETFLYSLFLGAPQPEDWEASKAEILRSLAHQLDAWHEHKLSGCQWRNRRALERQHADLDALFRHLCHGAPVVDPAERERLRRLARRIGLDFPRAAQKHRAHSV